MLASVGLDRAWVVAARRETRAVVEVVLRTRLLRSRFIAGVRSILGFEK
jgi:hypothetical protein